MEKIENGEMKKIIKTTYRKIHQKSQRKGTRGKNI